MVAIIVACTTELHPVSRLIYIGVEYLALGLQITRI